MRKKRLDGINKNRNAKPKNKHESRLRINGSRQRQNVVQVFKISDKAMAFARCVACRWVSLTGCLDNPSTGTAIDFQNQALKDFRDHRSVPNYRFW